MNENFEKWDSETNAHKVRRQNSVITVHWRSNFIQTWQSQKQLIRNMNNWLHLNAEYRLLRNQFRTNQHAII